MSDFGAIGGAIMISDQLAMYETMASSRRARQNQGLADEIAQLRYQNAEIIDHYNTLVQNFNQLQGYAADIAAQHDQQAQSDAELRAHIVSLEASLASQAEELARRTDQLASCNKLLKWFKQEYNKQVPGGVFDIE